jgi:hypothetical protein
MLSSTLNELKLMFLPLFYITVLYEIDGLSFQMNGCT